MPVSMRLQKEKIWPDHLTRPGELAASRRSTQAESDEVLDARAQGHVSRGAALRAIHRKHEHSLAVKALRNPTSRYAERVTEWELEVGRERERQLIAEAERQAERQTAARRGC